jgi:RNA polymerase sigma-70 factor (ECF subfamily)
VSSGASEVKAAEHRALSLEPTSALLNRLKAGEMAARDVLLSRYLLPLRRWAHGRLPDVARDLLDTDDVVQDTLLRTLSHLDDITANGDGAFLAYLRRALLNRIRDHLRRLRRRPVRETLKDNYFDEKPSPLEIAIGRETLAKYDEAMLHLPDAQQEAVMLRLEMGCSYEEIARYLGCRTANTARMMVARAMLRLATSMKAANGRPG